MLFESSITKVFWVIVLLIALNLFVRYVKGLRRQSVAWREQQQAQSSRTKAVPKKPDDNGLGEYVDYEVID
jgi:hypothetical protein